MRRSLALLLLVLLLAPAFAEGEAPDPSMPLTAEQVATKVLEAVRGEDRAALKALALKEDPDPWLVADALIARNEHEVAEAFAQAGEGKGIEKLAAYIASRRDQGDDAATRKAWSRAEQAIGGRDLMGAAAALKGVEPEPGTVHEALVGYGRASLLLIMGELEEAASVARLATDAALRLGWYGQAARIQIVQGAGRFARNDLNGALEAYRIALDAQRQRGDMAGIARTLHYLGNVRKQQGEIDAALGLYQEAQEIEQALGDREGVAGTLIDMAHLYVGSGRQSEALSHYERGLQIALAVGQRQWAANAIEGQGNVYSALGDYRKARSYYERALELRRALGHTFGIASALHNLGCVWRDLGDLEKALGHYEQALLIRKEIGYPRGCAETLTGLARLHLRMGDHTPAIACAEQALEIDRALGDGLRALDVLRTLGEATLAAGEPDKAALLFERAVREARGLRSSWLLPHLLADLARARLQAEDPELALSAALAALPAVEVALAKSSGEEGIEARASFCALMETGVLAARKCGDLDAAFQFLESGRAGSLLASLAGRRALRAAVLPEELLRTLVEAQQGVVAAREAFRKARTTSDFRTLRRLRKELNAAEENLLAAHERRQRAARQLVGPKAPRAATLAEARASLRPDQALVSYMLAGGEALAFVLTTERTALVSLGTSVKLREVVQGNDLRNTETPGKEALAALRRVLVEPLQLPAAATTVLVVPGGPIGTLPLGAIFDRPVALLPSTTTYLVLKEEAGERGTGVLALGDPDYGGKSAGGRTPFARLPATRLEAKAVGTDVLLGADASESGLVVALALRPRWRAVHLACHAVVDSKRPMLSALALTPDKTSDGLLTCLEVYGTEIPTDLAVLAGSHSALGKVYPGEGIVGLVRAFLYAGAPRVIGSVWCVDDLATRALMVKFYELWNPKEGQGIGCAAALKQAQDFVKGHKKWEHPYYWAGWVLWGVPE